MLKNCWESEQQEISDWKFRTYCSMKIDQMNHIVVAIAAAVAEVVAAVVAVAEVVAAEVVGRIAAEY